MSSQAWLISDMETGKIIHDYKFMVGSECATHNGVRVCCELGKIKDTTQMCTKALLETTVSTEVVEDDKISFCSYKKNRS